METKLFAQHNEEFEVIQTPRGLAWNPRTTNVNHQAAIVLKDAFERRGKWPEPRKIFLSGGVAVVFFPYKPERRTCHNEIHASCSESLQIRQRVSQNDFTCASRVKDFLLLRH